MARRHRAYPSQAPLARVLAILGLLASHAPPARAADGPKRPNIVVVLTDDQGYGDLARHGNPVVRTPNLDRLHDESVRFLDHYVSPTCSPTRTSFMTGRHEFKSGVTNTINERERMSLKSKTIAQHLQGAGYATGIFGKWHLGDEDAYQPEKRGFDEAFIHGAGGIGQSYPGTTCGDAPNNKYFDPAILHNGRFVKTKGYCTDVFFAQAESWMERMKGQKPFFCYVATNAPHAPLVCPEKYVAMYPGQPADAAKFFGMVTNIDDNVGRLLAKLKEWRIDDDTLVVVMNDNGGTVGVPIFNAGMRAQKTSAYRGGTRGIAFFRWPGTLQPASVDRTTAHLDLFPTFVELSGGNVPAGVSLDGRSLLPLLRDAGAAWPDRYLFTHGGRWPAGKAAEAKFVNCSVRHGNYSLVSAAETKGKGPPYGAPAQWELYDLKADPGERKDLAAARPELVKAGAEAYDRWWAEVFPLLENEDAYRTGPRAMPFVERYRKQFPTE